MFFLPAPGGPRLCVCHRPADDGNVRGTLLFVHPWAEEMNKSRHAVAVGSRALAREGWAVLQIDLFGCGDSSGEFGGATWDAWLQDVALAAKWLVGRFGVVPGFWGLRAGALVIADYLAAGGVGNGVLLWQPVISGKQHLTQFLRLKMVNEMLGNVAERSGTQELRGRIAKGEHVEVAGYRLSEGLAGGLERADLVFAPGVGRVLWVEVSSADEPKLSPASENRIARLAQRGVRVETSAVPGQAFWQTIEIAECPALVAKTVEMVGA